MAVGTELSGARRIERQDVGSNFALFGWILFLASFALYFASFAVRDDGQLLGNDAMPYAHQLVSGQASGLFNAHHLLFHPLALGIAKLLALLPGYEFNELSILAAQQLLSALGGALAVLMVFRLAARCSGLVTGGWIAAIFACSYGNWLYSAVGETYSPATGLIAVLLVQAVEVRLGWRKLNLPVLALWLLLAVSFRQDSVLVVVALPFLLSALPALFVMGAAGLLSLLLYIATWALADLDVSFMEWLRGLADKGIWGQSPTFESFTFSAGMTLMSIHCGAVHIRRIVAGNFDLLLTPLVLSAIGSATLILASLFRPRALVGEARAIAIGLVIFCLTRFIFFAWWQPTNIEYHTGTLLPLALLFALIISPKSRLARQLYLPLAFVLIASSNLLTAFLPNRIQTVAEHSAIAVEEAGVGGLLIALNANQYHAFLREPPPDAELVDAVDIFVRQNLAELPALMEKIDAKILSGQRVVLVCERDIWKRMGFPERRINIDVIGELSELYTTRELLDEDGKLWALILEP